MPRERWRWTTQRERAAGMVAADFTSDREIGAAVGVHPVTVAGWRMRPEFRQRVEEHVAAAREAARAAVVAEIERRVARLYGRTGGT